MYGLGPDSEGVAPAHTENVRPHKAASSKPGKKMSKKEARRAAREAREEMEDAIGDNVFSWKKAAKK